MTNLRLRAGSALAAVLLFGFLTVSNFVPEETRLANPLIPDHGLRLGLDLQEPRQALLVEQTGFKCVGGGQAAHCLTCPSRWPPEFEHRASRGSFSPLAHGRSK